jgi:D-lactate dehydrogenase (cytochrome)
VAALVARYPRVLPIGAQSSLTGGATPRGDLVLSTARMDRIVEIGRDFVRVQPGVPIATLQQALAERSLYYPPAPTYNGAFVGGTIATNASGAATFKYRSTREWVRSTTVVLATGEVLDLERGQVVAHPDGYFEIDGPAGLRRVPVPRYRMPEVPKHSAGYFAAPGMDLVDLFVGSEGTLGVIVEATLGLISPAPAAALAFVPFGSERQAMEVAKTLHDASKETWRRGDAHGLDVSAIELVDRRSIELLREDGIDAKYAVSFPPSTELALLVQLELAAGTTNEEAYAQIAAALDPDPPDGPLVRLCRLLDQAGVLDETEMALPGDRRRADQFFEVREAVPSAVKQRVAVAQERVHPGIEKTAADMVVPFERFGEMMQAYRRGFESRGLDYAIWGHASDGNVHPNVIPRTFEDVLAGREAILEFGREAARLGGCPLAEHGVGRNAVKQALLRSLYGTEGINQMRAVKAALDPEWKLAPGVVFLRTD